VLVLALDTSSPAVSAALVDVGPDGCEVLGEHVVVDARRHGELLALGVREVLGGRRAADLGAVVVGLGPGPFTGLRVGVVTAAALGDALGRPVVGVCSLDAVGSGARTVVTDARRKEVYWATYATDGSRTDGPAVVRPGELTADGPYVGDPAFADRLGSPVTPADVTTAGLLRAAAPQLTDPASAAPLVPLYLRRPDATPPTAIKAVSQP
jgi:tRNA threonylcarbamoyl adenosine modification protein YeaZ